MQRPDLRSSFAPFESTVSLTVDDDPESSPVKEDKARTTSRGRVNKASNDKPRKGGQKLKTLFRGSAIPNKCRGGEDDDKNDEIASKADTTTTLSRSIPSFHGSLPEENNANPEEEDSDDDEPIMQYPPPCPFERALAEQQQQQHYEEAAPYDDEGYNDDESVTEGYTSNGSMEDDLLNRFEDSFNMHSSWDHSIQQNFQQSATRLGPETQSCSLPATKAHAPLHHMESRKIASPDASAVQDESPENSVQEGDDTHLDPEAPSCSRRPEANANLTSQRRMRSRESASLTASFQRDSFNSSREEAEDPVNNTDGTKGRRRRTAQTGRLRRSFTKDRTQKATASTEKNPLTTTPGIKSNTIRRRRSMSGSSVEGSAVVAMASVAGATLLGPRGRIGKSIHPDTFSVGYHVDDHARARELRSRHLSWDDTSDRERPDDGYPDSVSGGEDAWDDDARSGFDCRGNMSHSGIVMSRSASGLTQHLELEF